VTNSFSSPFYPNKPSKLVCLWLPFALLLTVCILPTKANAFTGGTFGNSSWYYKIGGADAVMAPLNAHVTSATLGGSVNLGLGFNCSSFNPVLGLANTLNNAAQNIQSVLVNAASSAIASAPALILQRASPGLYELYQQLLSYANASVSLATKSCEQMQSDIAHGANPYDHWLTLSKSYTWRDQMGKTQNGNSSVDVVQALGIADNKGGDGGVPWVGGQNAGGQNQPPILIVTDVVKAGYNIEQGNDPASDNAGQSDTRIAQIWKTPAEAVDYAKAVLGDVKIETKNNADRKAVPGHGLAPKIEKDRLDAQTALAKLVDGTDSPSPEALAKVSAPGTQLNRDVVESIRRLQPQERAVVVGKLAAEQATAANVERAMMLRRLLLAGYQEPHVFASAAGPEIQRMVAVIDREIDQLLYETRVRKELFANTAGTVLDMAGKADGKANEVPGLRPNDTRPVENGAVPK